MAWDLGFGGRVGFLHLLTRVISSLQEKLGAGAAAYPNRHRQPPLVFNNFLQVIKSHYIGTTYSCFTLNPKPKPPTPLNPEHQPVGALQRYLAARGKKDCGDSYAGACLRQLPLHNGTIRRAFKGGCRDYTGVIGGYIGLRVSQIRGLSYYL